MILICNSSSTGPTVLVLVLIDLMQQYLNVVKHVKVNITVANICEKDVILLLLVQASLMDTATGLL